MAYVRLGAGRDLFPRLFYKDSSLVWRCATHFISAPGVHWIGKGDLKRIDEEDGQTEYSAEETTNLPYEMQGALDELRRRTKEVPWDARALRRILRGAGGRFEAYADFIGPSRRAAAKPATASTRAPGGGFESRKTGLPAHRAGASRPTSDAWERCRSASRSMAASREAAHPLAEREIQYQFVAGPARLDHPASAHHRLSSYGVRS